MSDLVQIPLGDGRMYGIHDDEETLTLLGPAILRHLGCNFEIKWPDKTPEDRARRELERQHTRHRMHEQADLWAVTHTPFHLPESLPELRELMIEAFRAGWQAAPKTINR